MRFRTVAEWIVILVPCAVIIWLILSSLSGPGFIPVSGPNPPPAIAGSIGTGGLFQEPLSSPLTFTTRIDDWQYTLTARYRYTIAAKVIGKREYFELGPDKISPMDIAVASGDVIKPEYFQYFRFTQGQRNFFYSVQCPRGISMPSKSYCDEHMSNNHLVFLNESVHNAAKLVRIGDCIFIKGYLVDISGVRVNGERYSRATSISRTDSYPAGCEVVLVESIEKAGC